MTCQKISEILQGSQLDNQSDIFIAPAPGIWVLVPPPPIPTGDHPSSPPPPCRCTKCTDIHNSDIFLLFNFFGKNSILAFSLGHFPCKNFGHFPSYQYSYVKFQLCAPGQILGPIFRPFSSRPFFKCIIRPTF